MSRPYSSRLYSFPGFWDLYTSFVRQHVCDFSARATFEPDESWIGRMGPRHRRELTMSEYVMYQGLPDVTGGISWSFLNLDHE